jgi:hypothetical protein
MPVKFKDIVACEKVGFQDTDKSKQLIESIGIQPTKDRVTMMYETPRMKYDFK